MAQMSAKAVCMLYRGALRYSWYTWISRSELHMSQTCQEQKQNDWHAGD